MMLGSGKQLSLYDMMDLLYSEKLHLDVDEYIDIVEHRLTEDEFLLFEDISPDMPFCGKKALVKILQKYRSDESVKMNLETIKWRRENAKQRNQESTIQGETDSDTEI